MTISLGKAAGQWSSYAEISIKRILRRDGESTYHINNIHVRRRDVADIFLGTGIGGRGYAIIEQGMISRIIEAKPEELRVFLEEAAGISRYRERRRETELRLADTSRKSFAGERYLPGTGKTAIAPGTTGQGGQPVQRDESPVANGAKSFVVCPQTGGCRAAYPCGKRAPIDADRSGS